LVYHAPRGFHIEIPESGFWFCLVVSLFCVWRFSLLVIGFVTGLYLHLYPARSFTGLAIAEHAGGAVHLTISNEQHPSRKARCWRVRACFIQEVVAANIIRIDHMPGKQIPADCATKHAIPHLRTIARRVCAVDRIIPDANGDTITNVSGMQGKGES